MDDCGFHNIWDITLNDNAILVDEDALNNFFYDALKRSGFKTLGHLCHKFTTEGKGVTGLFLLSESHLSFHTYPERNYLSIDIYTCGRNSPGLYSAIEIFFNNSERFIFRSIERGSHIHGYSSLKRGLRR